MLGRPEPVVSTSSAEDAREDLGLRHLSRQIGRPVRGVEAVRHPGRRIHAAEEGALPPRVTTCRSGERSQPIARSAFDDYAARLIL
jgi:hypothetical protein